MEMPELCALPRATKPDRWYSATRKR